MFEAFHIQFWSISWEVYILKIFIGQRFLCESRVIGFLVVVDKGQCIYELTIALLSLLAWKLWDPLVIIEEKFCYVLRHKGLLRLLSLLLLNLILLLEFYQNSILSPDVYLDLSLILLLFILNLKSMIDPWIVLTHALVYSFSKAIGTNVD